MFFKKRAKHLALGVKGEKAALKEMQRLGLDILHKNFAIHDVGEIDIIARDGACVVFTEVKTRRQKGKSRAGEAVDREKRQKIWKTAKYYLKRTGCKTLRYRFDVVEVYIYSPWHKEVRYLANAYDQESF
mgnify:CR=1 FL=1|jgi:putative endonuclease